MSGAHAVQHDAGTGLQCRDVTQGILRAVRRAAIDVEQQIANAWILYADGKYDDALKAMSAAAKPSSR